MGHTPLTGRTVNYPRRQANRQVMATAEARENPLRFETIWLRPEDWA
jgi:hypothetical protein